MDWKEALKSPWAIAAVLLFGTNGGRKLLKSASKEVIKVGLTVSDKVKEIVAEVKEEADDLVAEVQEERKTQSKEKQISKA
ncbi:MAG: hypothetical protein K2X77_16570 [Candidatus Obscuribacterales bacterium]|jgi:hypothetical protein|nr:hypothetical protein [Candidatus Obscuribacterales bacterium]